MSTIDDGENGGGLPFLFSESSVDPIEGVHYIINHYAVLGVAEDATDEEIRTAFRVQINDYHPDRYENAAEEYREDAARKANLLIKAHEVLRNPELRSGLDDNLALWREQDRPISNDGTPIIRTSDMLGFQGPEAYSFLEQMMLAVNGYDEKIVKGARETIAGLEALDLELQRTPGIAAALANARRTLASQLQKCDDALASIQEMQAQSLGVRELGPVGGDYLASMAAIAEARSASLEGHLAGLAIAAATSTLALESGQAFGDEQDESTTLVAIDEEAIRAGVAAQVGAQLKYFMNTTAARAELVENRLQAMDIHYPIEQPVLHNTYYVGIIYEQGEESNTYWVAFGLDAEGSNLDPIEITPEAREQLETTEGITAIVEAGANVFTVDNTYQRIDIAYFLSSIIQRHMDSYKTDD